mmetsp:Transcript_64482/g.124243  ORF Transcript_64482/g.124243 Transcript_64482/m.124243 type:complete len:227 (-) Transcript_64482:300-980(-)
MQWQWDGADIETTTPTCTMASGPTVWDLFLQVFCACFGLGCLRLMMWRLLKDQEEMRNERRRARLEQQQQLLEYFERRWPPTTEEDAQRRGSTAAAGNQQRREDEEAALLDSDAEAAPCSICMQPLVDLPEHFDSIAEQAGTAAVSGNADLVQLLLGRSFPVQDGTTQSADMNDCGGGRVIESACPGAHRFHRGCLRGWVRRGRSSCPICKLDVRGPDAAASPATG